MTIIINILKHCHVIAAVLLISAFLPLQTTAAQVVVPLESSPRAPNENANPSLAILLVILILALFITGFCSIYIRHCSEAYVASGDAAIGPRGVDPEVLSTFPITIYSAVKRGRNAAVQCAVCLSEFDEFDALRLLPKCGHVFHPGCIDAWLASHVTCPVCRAKLKAEEAEVKVEIGEEENSANQVFGESSERRGEVFGGGIDGGAGVGVDGVVGNGNGSSKVGALRVLVRSHSTGHSLVEPGKCSESFTLRKQIIVDGRMKRSASYDVVLQCGGEGISKGRNSRWVLSMTPPFVYRGCGSSSFAIEEKECEGRMGLQVV